MPVINDIKKLFNLQFYSQDGNLIYSQKDYVITWKLLPSNDVTSYFHEIPEGYFACEIDANRALINETMFSGFINSGKIFCDKYTYLNVDFHSEEYMLDIFAAPGNKVRITVNINNVPYVHDFDVRSIFDLTDSNIQVKKEKIYTGTCNNDDITDEYYYYLSYDNMALQYVYDVNTKQKTNEYFVYRLLTNSIENIGNAFPFVYYSLSYEQEKVSTDFIAVDSIYTTPISFEKDTTLYSLVFKPESDSEINIVKPIKDALNTYDIQYIPEYTYELFQNENPLSLTVAFTSEHEGCYQNFIGMYLQQKDTENSFFIGVIVIKTEVEGEDERYRALLGNFGIPDPKDYANIFSDQEYDEEGTDYRIVNEKSKELMLTYDQIFPYTGTYKALLNAIKFLGYSDIIFKEWYHIKDNNDNQTDVAIQRMDIENRKYLKDMLNQYGVSIEDFNNYSKMNKLTMVYHLNCIKENEITKPCDVYKIIPVTKDTDKTNVPNGFRLNSDQTAFISIEPIQAYTNTYNQRNGKDVFQFAYEPVIEKIFKYTNSGVIGKLWAVCKWLDKYILGVNSYIQDITGEGIVFSTFKTRGYVTQHELYDYKWQGSYTLKPECSSIVHEFNPEHENTFINLTLNEYTKLTFDDFNDDTFESFAREIYNLPNEYKTKFGIDKIYFSNTFNNPVNAEKYSIVTEVQPQSVAFNGIIIENNNIFETQYNDIHKVAYDYNDSFQEKPNINIDAKVNDTVRIKEGYVIGYKKMVGDQPGVYLKVYPIIDPKTGQEQYKLELITNRYDIATNVPILSSVQSGILLFSSIDRFSPYSNTPLFLRIPNDYIGQGYGLEYRSIDNNYINDFKISTINSYGVNIENLNIVNGDIILNREFKDSVYNTEYFNAYGAHELTYKILFHTENAVNDVNSQKYITPTVYSKFDFHHGYYSHDTDITQILQNSNDLETLNHNISNIYNPVVNMKIPVYYNGKYNTKLITYDNHGNKFTTYQKNLFEVMPSYTGISLITDKPDNSIYKDNSPVTTIKDIDYNYTFNLLQNNSYYRLNPVKHDRENHSIEVRLEGYNKPDITENTYISFISRFDNIFNEWKSSNDEEALAYKKIGENTYIPTNYNPMFNYNNKQQLTNLNINLSKFIIDTNSIEFDNENKTTSFKLQDDVYNNKFSEYTHPDKVFVSGVLTKVRIEVDNLSYNEQNTTIDVSKHNRMMESVFRIVSYNQYSKIITINGILPIIVGYNELDKQKHNVTYTLSLPQSAIQEYITPLQEKPVFYSKTENHLNVEMMKVTYNNTLFPIEQYTDDVNYKPYLVTHNTQNKVLTSSINDFIKKHVGIELDNTHLLNTVDEKVLNDKLIELQDKSITVSEGTEVLVHPLMNHYSKDINILNKFGSCSEITYCRIRHYVEQVMDMTNANMNNINTYNHRTLINEIFNTYTIEKLIHKGKHTFIFDIYDRFGNHYQNSIQDIVYVK